MRRRASEPEEFKEEEPDPLDQQQQQQQQQGLDDELRQQQQQEQEPQDAPNNNELVNDRAVDVGMEQPRLKEDELSPEVRRRRCILWTLGLFLTLGLIVVIVVFSTGLVKGPQKDKSDENVEDLSGAWTDATPVPVPAMLIEEPQEQMDFVLSAMAANSVMETYVDMFPQDISELKDKQNDPDENPMIRAMAWLVHVDPFDEMPELVERFALASIYYTSGGGEGEWLVEENWLSDSSICSGWFGITCCGQFHNDVTLRCNDRNPKDIAELDLHSNNLHGTISDAVALLEDLHVLWLDNNKLTGPLKGEVFGAMPSLTELYVQHNRLTGPIQPSLRANGLLHTLFIQNNLFEGKWPSEFCPGKESGAEIFMAFGLDCDRNACPTDCCYKNFHPLHHCLDGWVNEND